MERSQAEDLLRRAGVDEATRQTLDVFNRQSDPPVYRVQTQSTDAVYLWQDLARAARGMAWPIILGNAHDVSLLTDLPPRPAALHLADANRHDAVALLREHLQGRLDDDGDPESREEQADFARVIAQVEAASDTLWLAPAPASMPALSIAEFPGEDFMRSSVAEGYQRTPQTVSVALIPTLVAADAPAYLNFGGFNGCPPPSEHVALHRRWAQLYGTELLACSGDVLEARVRRPPTTDAGALALAVEQYLYCPDIVDQGVGSIEELANELKNSPRWFFWWD